MSDIEARQLDCDREQDRTVDRNEIIHLVESLGERIDRGMDRIVSRLDLINGKVGKHETQIAIQADHISILRKVVYSAVGIILTSVLIALLSEVIMRKVR